MLVCDIALSHRSVFLDYPGVEGIWLGGSELAAVGDWRWASDNSVITFDYWYDGQPDNAEEHCLYTVRTNSKFGDAFCGSALAFFCEWLE